MTVRKKKGHIVTVAPPVVQEHGRPLAMAAASVPRAGDRDAAHRYALGCIERNLARAMKDPTKARTAARRAERAKAALLLEPNGLQEVQAIHLALSADGGAALRCAAKAHAATREYAVLAADTLVSLVREHRLETSAGLAYAGSAAAWMALERLLLDRLFAGVMRPEALKMAGAASSSARHAMGWALHIEQQARDARPAPAFAWTLPSRPHDAPGTSIEAQDPPEPQDVPMDAPEPDMEQDGHPDDQELEPDPDETPEYENRFSYSDHEPVPQASEPPGGAVRVGRAVATAVVAPRTHDAQGRLIVPVGGPDAAALREMTKRGIDTGRWEKP